MFSSTLKSGFLQIAGLAAGFFVHITLARLLSVQDYGVFNFIFALSAILAMVAMFGLPQAVIRLTQEYLAAGDRASLRGLVIFSRALPLLFGAGLGGLVYTGLFFAGQFPDMYLLIAGAMLVPLLAMIRVHSALLRGFKRIGASVFYEVTYRDLVFANILAALFLSNIFIGASFVLFALASVLALGVVFSGAHVGVAAKENIAVSDPKYDTPHWLGIAWPMMLTVATRMLLVRTDLIILGFMVSSFDLGIYAGAAKFAMLVALAQMAVMPFFTPNAAQLYQQGRGQDLRKLFFKAQTLQILGGLALLGFLVVSGKTLLGILGVSYVAGYNVYLILLVGQFIGVACGPSSAILEMTAFEKQTMRVVMIFALLNLLLTPALIYVMGLEGAALATSISFVGQNFACYVVAWRKGLLGHGT